MRALTLIILRYWPMFHLKNNRWKTFIIGLEIVNCFVEINAIRLTVLDINNRV